MESSKGRKLYCYSALSNIVNTDDHYFIFISRPEAIIIPKASIDSKDLVSFIAFLEKERLVALK